MSKLIINPSTMAPPSGYSYAVKKRGKRHFAEGAYPASTYLVVSALAVPQLLVEVEAVAMLE